MDRQKIRVLVAERGASQRRRLARDVLDGGFEALTAPDLTAASSVLKTRRVAVVLTTLELCETGTGLDELTGADPHVQLLLGAAPHDADAALSIARGRACLTFTLPLADVRWLHLAIDRLAAHRHALDRLLQSRDRELDRALASLASAPYREAKEQLMARFERRYVEALLERGSEAERSSGLSPTAFRRLVSRARA